MASIPPELLTRASAGEPEAQLALGRHYAMARNVRMARGWLARAAKGGMAAALRELGVNLLTQQPLVESDGVGFLREAAEKGDGEAAYLCGLIAVQDPRLPDRWQVGLDHLAAAAARGHAGAADEARLLAGAVERGMAAAPPETCLATPHIAMIRGILEPALCDWLMERYRPALGRASIYDRHTGGERIENARSNSHVALDLTQMSYVIALLRARIAAAAPADCRLEMTTVLNYRPGEQFVPHVDYLDPAVPAYGREVAAYGQRIATCLVYLNTDYEGGETVFPKLGRSFRGDKGDALLFWNTDAERRPDPRTIHAGAPPSRGEKWAISQWLRAPVR